jgi:hypothetical protein
MISFPAASQQAAGFIIDCQTDDLIRPRTSGALRWACR